MKQISSLQLKELIEQHCLSKDFVYTKLELQHDLKPQMLKSREVFIPEKGKFGFLILNTTVEDKIQIRVLCYDDDFKDEITNFIKELLSQVCSEVEFGCFLNNDVLDFLKFNLKDVIYINELNNCSYCYESEASLKPPGNIVEITENDYKLISTMADQESGLNKFFDRIFIKKQLKHVKMYCLVKEGIVKGFILRHYMDEDFDDVGYIYVDKNERKKHYGTDLLKYFVLKVKKDNKIPYYSFAETEISAKTALGVGFKPCAKSWSVIISRS